MLELRAFSFSKNVAFNAIDDFHQWQEYHGQDVWQMVGIDILMLQNSNVFLYLGIKK